jgi:opacity protein-like surface antigen
MKKVMSVLALSTFALTASVVFAGSPGKTKDPVCPEECQQQIDALKSSQARQDEQLGANGKQLENHEDRITTLEKGPYNPWYGRIGVRAAWMTQDINVPTGSSTEADSKAGFGGALAFGRQFGQFRAELEAAGQGADLDDFSANNIDWDGELRVLTVMANGYYEIPVSATCAFFGMVGLGYANYDLTVDRINDGPPRRVRDANDNLFAYKAGVGVSYNFTDKLAGDLGYEYLGVADASIADSINGHNVVLSFRYKY